MTTWLTACVYAPHLMVDVARRYRSSIRPLAVTVADNDRAPIIDCDAQARAAGVEIGMSVQRARRQCSDLEIRLPDRGAIAEAANTIARVLAEQMEDVRRLGSGRWTARAVALGQAYRAAPALAEDLQATVTTTTGIQSQVGLARTTIVAEIAARLAHVVTIVLPDTETAFLAPLPVGLLPGVGVKTLAALKGLGITTIGHLQMLSPSALAHVCGNRGRSIARLAHGLDATNTMHEPTTITVRWVASGEPEADVHRLRAYAHTLTTEAGRELRARDSAAGDLTVRVVWSDGSHGQSTERDPMRRNLDSSLTVLSKHALDRMLRERRLAVRALTLTLDDLGPRQIDLFAASDDRPWHLQHALDRLALRFGPQTILPGSLIGMLPATV